LLSAAGIDVWAEVDITDPPPAVERVLVGTVREGVMGVLRYSSATTCSITGGTRGRMLWLAITNDGAHPSTQDNAGLRGLADRARALSGIMSATLTDDRQYHLLVELPEDAS
jgi:signal transduction histidine kinase